MTRVYHMDQTGNTLAFLKDSKHSAQLWHRQDFGKLIGVNHKGVIVIFDYDNLLSYQTLKQIETMVRTLVTAKVHFVDGPPPIPEALRSEIEFMASLKGLSDGP